MKNKPSQLPKPRKAKPPKEQRLSRTHAKSGHELPAYDDALDYTTRADR
jgi:hypothetical protein